MANVWGTLRICQLCIVKKKITVMLAFKVMGKTEKGLVDSVLDGYTLLPVSCFSSASCVDQS